MVAEVITEICIFHNQKLTLCTNQLPAWRGCIAITDMIKLNYASRSCPTKAKTFLLTDLVDMQSNACIKHHSLEDISNVSLATGLLRPFRVAYIGH